MEKSIYLITGMSCAACSARVEKVVGAAPGVAACTVNLATGRMNVEYDLTALSQDMLETVIGKTGFGFKEIKDDEIGSDETKQEITYKESSTLRVKFIISAFFAVPLLYIAMGICFRLDSVCLCLRLLTTILLPLILHWCSLL